MDYKSSYLISLLVCLAKPCLSNEVQIGVILPESSHYPWSIQRVLPAINIAIEYVQNDILPGTRLEILVADSDCSETKASLAAFELYQKKAHVLLGPVCNYAVAPVARFSTNWNIPIITAGASVVDFDTKNEFKLLTRIHETKTLTAESVVHFTEVFNWTHIGLIYEENVSSAKSECFFTMQAIYFKLMNRYGIAPYSQKFDKNSDFEDILRSASSKATGRFLAGMFLLLL
jgi:ABC-type branched-subunit amino acid transport system substrate-binding protein